MAPIGAKLCKNACQTSSDISFFDAKNNLFLQTLNGCLLLGILDGSEIHWRLMDGCRPEKADEWMPARKGLMNGCQPEKADEWMPAREG